MGCSARSQPAVPGAPPSSPGTASPRRLRLEAGGTNACERAPSSPSSPPPPRIFGSPSRVTCALALPDDQNASGVLGSGTGCATAGAPSNATTPNAACDGTGGGGGAWRDDAMWTSSRQPGQRRRTTPHERAQSHINCRGRASFPHHAHGGGVGSASPHHAHQSAK